MNASELAALADARLVGREWHGFCPAHRGKSRSLHFRDSDRGGIVMICRAGCETKDVLAALGLTFRHISPDSPRPPLPQIARIAQSDPRTSLSRNLPAAVRQQPATVIYTDRARINEAIARGLALAVVNRELVQLALREKTE